MTQPRKRSRQSAKDAGARFEREVADWLAEHVDDRIDRRAKTGAKDRGDIGGVRLSPALNSGRVVIECKNTTRIELATWTREADTARGNDDAAVGIVVHKRHGTQDPADQWVTMTMADLATLLTGYRPEETR